MCNFPTLYVYELRKILKRKIVWITMGIMIILTVFMGAGELFSTYTITTGQDREKISGFEYLTREKENALSISGKKIDDDLLQEVKDAYKGLHVVTPLQKENTGISSASSYELVVGSFGDETKEERENLQKKREQYKSIYRFVNNVMRNEEAIHSINEEMLYQTRLGNLHNLWGEQRLTEGEKAYWAEKENEIDKPFVYGYAEGWNRILELFLSLNFMLVLAIAVCLSNVFSDEHLRKTDQLILCSKYGKKILFFSKMAAGMTFGLGCAVILLMFAICTTLCVYGIEGYDVAVQVYLPICSWNLTMGQAVILISVAYIVAAIFVSVVAMFLSEAMKNSVAVMGLMTGIMIFTMFFNVPYRFRVISQIYGLFPTVLLTVWQLWDDRLVSVSGMHFTNFQIAPIVYIVVSIVLIFGGNKIYKHYQVSGR